MARGRPDPERDQKAVTLRKSGATYRQIADELGFTSAGVAFAACNRDKSRASAKRRWEEKRDAMRAYNSAYSRRRLQTDPEWRERKRIYQKAYDARKRAALKARQAKETPDAPT